MTPLAYYNEIDPFAAQWLRNLINAGHIAQGYVDERSIEDVTPTDLAGYTQCHFFAGIGVWSRALRSAGWPDDRPVWTGSCPCQPFSVAGKQDGHTDPRHLWPAWFRLIRECRPAVIFGEQVEAAIRHGWLDLVQADLEGEGYACGATVLGAHSVGAPHIRQRLWFVAHSFDCARQRSKSWTIERIVSQGIGEVFASELAHDQCEGLERTTGSILQGRVDGSASIGEDGFVAHSNASERGSDMAGGNECNWAATRRHEGDSKPGEHCEAGFVANPLRDECGQVGAESRGCGEGSGEEGMEQRSLHCGVGDLAHSDDSGPQGWGRSQLRECADQRPSGESLSSGSFWSDCDWLPCRDGKWRPTQPGLFPLAHGASQRVGRLRAYGNAIVAEVAQAFIESYLSCE